MVDDKVGAGCCGLFLIIILLLVLLTAAGLVARVWGLI